MTSLRISATANGKVVDDAMRTVTRLTRQTADFTDLYMAFGRHIVGRVEETFKAQGLPQKWAPLSPAYARAKAAAGFGGKPILVRTGKLRKSFRFTVSLRGLTVRSSRNANGVNLYDIHQNGTRKMPARPMFIYLPQDAAVLTELVEEHLNDV